MGTTLTGTKPKDTYDSLIKVGDNGPIGATAKTLSDGLGNDLPISVSTTNVGIGTSEPNYKLEVLGGVISTYQGGLVALKTYTKTVGFQVSSYQSVNGGPFTKTTDLVANADTGVPSEMRILTAPAGGNPTEVARFLSTGGITFNGDTAAANALDDYEEGTWTMGISFGGGSTGITYIFTTGNYTKIGRQVNVTGWVRLSSKGSSTGVAKITGLPFTNGAASQFYTAVNLGYIDNISFADVPNAYVETNATTIYFMQTTNAGVLSDLTDANFANNSSLMINATYYV
jgi:hypothetical protein